MTDSATWGARFEAFTVNAFDVALDAPQRGVVVAGGIEPHQAYAWDRTTGDLRRTTNAPGGLVGAWISADGRWILYLDDPGASEEGVLVRVPFEGGEPQPADGSLQPGPVMAVVAHGHEVAFTTVRDDRYEHRIADVDREGSRLIATDAAPSYVGGFADDGRTLILIRFRDDETRETILLDVATGREVGRLAAPGATMRAYLPSPIPGARQFLADSDESGFVRPLVWDADTGTRTPLDLGGLDGTLRPIAWSPDGHEALLVQIDRAELRLHLYDLRSGATRRLATPDGTVTALPDTFSTVFVSDDEILTLWQSGEQPRAVLSVPVHGGEPRVVVGDRTAPPGHRWSNVTFPSLDGTEVQAWLARPTGDGPFPAIIDVHGGPGAVQFNEYLPMLLAFVDRGFVVLSVNYRSSLTFGTEFERAVIGRLGELEIDDMVAAKDYLVRSGLVDPARVLVEGWSYGGYLALMALGRAPGAWAGGICGVGIGDLVAQHAEAAPFIGSLFTHYMNGTPDDIPERYAASSPITYADRVRAPLLVIHGHDDIRCPPGQMERYLDRLATLGADVQAHWFTAGHLGGLANPALFRDHTALMLDFAERALTGPGLTRRP